MPIEAPCLELIFVERESIELRALQQSLSGAPGALLMLSSTAQVPAMLEAAFPTRQAQLLLVEGGLADRRADQLLAFARANPSFSSLRTVAFIDFPGARRSAFKPFSSQKLVPGPWLLAKFL